MTAVVTGPPPVIQRSVSLGGSVPAFTAHAISVSLPTWNDVVGYEEGDKRVVEKMVTGYPRFFIHLSIQKLAEFCEQKFAVNDEKCILCPTRTISQRCREFMIDRSSQTLGTPVNVRLVQYLISDESLPSAGAKPGPIELHIVLFPADAFPIAKEFWQHTGQGISSRLADRCLSMLQHEKPSTSPAAPTRGSYVKKGSYNRYAAKGSAKPSQTLAHSEGSAGDLDVYLEERYGRNLPQAAATSAKRTLRRRIAGVLVQDSPEAILDSSKDVGPSSRGISNVSEDDVFLYSTGMTAIWNAHQLALAVRPSARSICFGFPYTDTLKVLQKWGPGCHFLGHGLDSDIDELERILERESAASSSPPALALFTEFPSNPLLRSANLPRLRAIADKYDFLIVIDETIGNFMNVEILPYADIVVSSLTKIFSGDANVMGGSLVLNPKGRHYEALKTHISSTYEDFYFDEDAIFLERNSRDFRSRIKTIDDNTEAICDFLRSRSIVGGGEANSPVKDVYYPKWVTSQNYESCRTKGGEGGYGGLFSVTFSSAAASQAFFDALPCNKGPSLGTNFTLACPYTILAHFTELEWAAGYGVESSLVRISVGMEDRQTLLRYMETALRAAEAAVKDNKQ